MIIDSHTHIYEPEFDEDRDNVVQRALQVGVEHCILPNIDLQSVDRVCQTAMQYPHFCSIAMGLHPTSVDKDWEDQLNSIYTYLHKLPLVAIGEVGMDLYWDQSYIIQQRAALEKQISWALELDLPLILHSRDAIAETIGCIRRADSQGKSSGVFHSFTGTEKDLDSILALPNYMVGINGVLTFKKSSLSGFIGKIPLDRLLVETDAPYLAPVPRRGKRNEPAYCTYILEHLSKIFGVQISDIAQQTTENAIRLFRLFKKK
ncbi:hydrolase TatD [Porphyromonas crevioricanis]|uniref:Uncharacterized deoxyribonuclease YcfH n=2 Tax=Porphyromonas crevioricanis TaxID=393921 RepID=A0A0A2FIZ9_9PORP|nr:TatD family hydrolase [Porphyromonas crevioricanis]KGN90953.1 hydrolase TatD [Porphyromonas crevioricanis]SJZ54274.1 TatD DNase family protein [Porphyromonas crevioricanis]SQH73279.1 Uncharacterized deoxyribonuclease YcfH [Porphyromonas crevioricanis]GAD06263.1 putative deoxyribonuclease YcfH [Porphyromonas crevioricanis JCM 15906]GAD06763.1 putative deoxyribonuclease YcfH [Porphyromonas crevioricanis JCM 13913]